MGEVTALNTFSPERQGLLAILDDGNSYNVTELCEQAGVSRKAYYDAIQDEAFVKQLFQTTSGKVYKSIPKIMDKVVQQAERGSFAHQKMLFEMMKIYQGTPTVAIQNNTQVNYNFSKEELLDEAYRLVAEDTGKTVEELKQ